MNIFNNSDIGSISLIKYVSLFINKSNEDYNLIQLPPIQRNAVWHVEQIERLWDSIMRGFPIGSFLLSNREKGSVSRGVTEKEQVISKNTGFFLLDGQQRTRAILLGFNHSENARLWIDLKPTLSFDNIEHNDRHFLFRVTTTHQPWGMKCSKPEDKISEEKKHKARGKLYQKSLRYDYQVKINIPAHHGEPVSWPIEANIPIPFDDLVKLCGGYTGFFREPQWNEVIPLIPNDLRQDGWINETEHFSEIIMALKRILDSSSENEYQRSVALLIHNGDFYKKNENAQDAIEVLFRRINSKGTILNGEEMQYSLLKATWDRAYDMVYNIISDDKIGYLFSSTGIVLSAARLARYNINEHDDSSPNVTKFRKWIGDKKQSEGKSFLDEMKHLLETNPESNKSIYHSTIEEFCNLIVFNENTVDDIGIPKKLLLSINSKYYHPVIIWIYLNRNNHLKIKNNRLSILRYLMFSLIGFDDADKVSRKANHIIRNNNHGDDFPDRIIYQQCVKEQLAIIFPSISDFKK
ncbi:DUF262 domain-containing protein [Thiothrix subterranea]|uniref:DUF262 domain-containing protein n=1 Tax=Thiothrix subterranea TaxID=2735563 RepID=A0AA51R2P8_9GAMM|nr:DUF262 domain-containing protein [Thiothrix subterranea]WML88089.1 DUF262 domain-containing protein [Thiothrix subterranea]